MMASVMTAVGLVRYEPGAGFRHCGRNGCELFLGFRRVASDPAKACVFCVLMICLVAMLTGCSGYQLQGRVIEGAVSKIEVVGKNDLRMLDREVYVADRVVLRGVLDPVSIRPITLAQTVVERDGSFSIPVGAPGAGVLKYQLELTVSGPGYAPYRERLPLPGGGKRLLITVRPGGGGDARAREAGLPARSPLSSEVSDPDIAESLDAAKRFE